MAWTYDSSLFNSITAGYYSGSTVGERYQIRLWLQDTNTSRQLFQDEEIDFTRTQVSNKYLAAADLCDMLVAKAGAVKMKQISEFKIQYDPAFYRYLSGVLRAKGASYQVPYAGGISITDKLAQQADSDWVPPAFPRGMGDNPGAPAPRTPSTNPLTTI